MPDKESATGSSDGSFNDGAVGLHPHIEGLEANNKKLIELVLTLVESQVDNLGNKMHVQDLEEGLRGIERDQERRKEVTKQLQKHVEDLEQENLHLSLVAKRYKTESESEKRLVCL